MGWLSDYAEAKTTDVDMTPERASEADVCRHCKGAKSVRNPTGDCDHLYWPEYLTTEAKRANGIPE